MHRFFNFILSSFVLICFQSYSNADYDFNSHKGLYVFHRQADGVTRQPRIDELENSLSKPNIDGLTLQIGWDQLETAPNEFNWIEFDKIIKIAMLNGKKIGLGVGGGANAPDWLTDPNYNFNVPFLELTWDRTGKPSDCHTKKYPIPWGAKYKNRYIKMMTEVVAHLKTIKSVESNSVNAMNAIKYVKLAGINITSSESMIPSDKKEDVEVCNSKNNEKWINAGYTREKITTAWKNISDETAALFPNRPIVLMVISNGAFPPIDSKGEIIDVVSSGNSGAQSSYFDLITRDLIEYGKNTYRSRFTVEWAALNLQPQGNMDELISLVGTSSKVAWQLNQRGERGSGYNSNIENNQDFIPVCNSENKTCNIPAYQGILDIGIGRYRAEWLELHLFDVNLIDNSYLKKYSEDIKK